MNGVFDVLRKLGPQRLAAMGAVTLALVGFFGFLILRLSTPAMTTLFTDLTMQDTTAITRELDQRGIRYEMRHDGGTVMVPKDMALRLRMDLAGKGLPSGGGIGYEIFDKSDAFSATTFVQNINQLRALEGELARTIRTLDRVQNARVHLALPERQLFNRDKKEARASIVLKVRGELDAGQIRAIRHLAASAVEGLKADHVSIVDEAGRLLADGAGGDGDPTGALAEKQQGYERKLRAQVEDIVASVVGRGRARVQVAADMDFNRIEERSESFDPESRVVRSTQTRNENNVSNDAREGQVTVGNELPGAGQNNGQNNTREAGQKAEEIVNYEISRTTRNTLLEGGRVKRLSVAVLVDGTYVRSGSDVTYTPRAGEELDRIGALVRSAIGFDARRGDQLEVVNLRFAEAPPPTDIKELSTFERLISFSKDDTLRMLEIGVFALLTLFVVLFVVNPLMKQMSAPEKAAQAAKMVAGPGGGAPGQETGLLSGASGGGSSAKPGDPPTETEKMIEFAQVNGAIQQRSIERVGEVASKAPQETVAVLRQWIHGNA